LISRFLHLKLFITVLKFLTCLPLSLVTSLFLFAQPSTHLCHSLTHFFFLYEIFFAMSGPAPCHWWWQQPFLGARALVCSSALIAFQQAGQRLAPHSTTLGAFQQPCAGIPLCRDLQSKGGTSKASVRLGVDDYNPPGYRFTRLLNFKSSCGSILACTFAFLSHKSCHVNPRRMLDFFFFFCTLRLKYDRLKCECCCHEVFLLSLA